MSSPTQAIDLTLDGLTQWSRISEIDKRYWQSFFELKPFDRSIIQSFEQYAHSYNYSLSDEDIARVVFCATLEILKYNHDHHMTHVFFGNSGGLDSATTCALLSKAIKLGQEINRPFTVTSYGLPIDSNPDHNVRATRCAEIFGIRHLTIESLDEVFSSFQNVLKPLSKDAALSEEQERRALGNVKARLRMIVNFFGTAKPGSYVISTDNLSELYMAFWTLMGDVGAFGPIQHLLKGLELPSIAYALGVPEKTIQAKPTDGLGVHTSLDEHEGGDVDAFHGVPYPHLDAIICHAAASGLDLTKAKAVPVDATKIRCPQATQEVVDQLIAQMTSPSSVWKRTRGSIGTGISREQLGLLPVLQIAGRL